MSNIRDIEAKVAELLNGWEDGFTEHLKNNDGWILIPHYSDLERGIFKLIEGAREQGVYLSINPIKSGYSLVASVDGYLGVKIALFNGEVASIEEVGHALVRMFLRAKGVNIDGL